jgi:hypothetical protein
LLVRSIRIIGWNAIIQQEVDSSNHMTGFSLLVYLGVSRDFYRGSNCLDVPAYEVVHGDKERLSL